MTKDEKKQLEMDITRIEKMGYDPSIQKKYVANFLYNDFNACGLTVIHGPAILFLICRRRAIGWPGALRISTDIYRRLAPKYAHKRIEDAMKSQWKEMGLLSVTFSMYQQDDDKIFVEL